MSNSSAGLVALMLLVTALLPTSDASRKRISTEILQNTYTLEDIRKEIEFGREMAAIILADFKMLSNQQVQKYLNLVGHSLLQHSSRQEIPFRFALINSPIINAYAAPGGYIFVTRSAVNLMQSEAELAGVLAHEIAHVTQRHIVKALKIRASDDSATSDLGQILGGASSTANVVFDQAVSQAIEILFSKGLQREDEYDADEVGIVLTALAGYDPGAYVQYLRRIEPYVSQKGAQMNKTHPPIKSRIKKIERIMRNEGLDEMQGFINVARFAQNYQTP